MAESTGQHTSPAFADGHIYRRQPAYGSGSHVIPATCADGMVHVKPYGLASDQPLSPLEFRIDDVGTVALANLAHCRVAIRPDESAVGQGKR